jgi:chromosome segregation ATPase
VSELEAQASKDKASTAALETAKEELAERVSELEEQVSSNEEDARVLYDAKRELGNRVIELETQAVEDKARAVAVDAAKAALVVRVSELERKVSITLKEKDEVDSLVRELRDSMALHAADLIKTTEAYVAREQSLQRLVKARDAEFVGLQERLDRLTLAQNSRDKENQNNLMIIKEHREKKGFLEATTTELKHQVGELEAQRDRLRVKAAHARFGGRQSEGIASRQENSSLRDSVSSSHGAFDLASSGAENFNMGHMGDFSDSDISQLPDVFTSPDTTTTAIDSDFDVDSDMDRSRLSDAARKVTPAGRGAG